MQNNNKFNLRLKLVLFVGILAAVTYSVSFIFIEVIQPTFFPQIDRKLFEIVTYILGIMWSCILAAIFSVVLVRPLQQLSKLRFELRKGRLDKMWKCHVRMMRFVM